MQQGSNCQNWLLNWMIEIYEGKTLLFRFTLNQISIAKNPNKFVLNFMPPSAWNTKNGQSPTHWALSSLFKRKPLMLLIFQSFCGKFILWKIQEQKIYMKKKFKKDVIDFLRYEGKKRNFCTCWCGKMSCPTCGHFEKKYLSINATC